MFDADQLNKHYLAALADRRAWDGLWRECYDLALPNATRLAGKGQRRTDQIFDATAMDAVDQLATALLGQVTPPWTPWFALKCGTSLSAEEKALAAPKLDDITNRAFAHITHSNFTVEMHQCFLELVTAGTACLAVHEAMPGSLSAFRFEAVPLSDIVMEEGDDGRLSTIYRPLIWTAAQMRARFPDLPIRLGEDEEEIAIVEAILSDNGRITRVLFLPEGDHGAAMILDSERLEASPYIAFRWQKAAGEPYGRSPVMKALPDIKTANKVVELILKNASIAVTGIWQADDDGVLNPATVILEPGAIIPKAVGSQGLKPLEMPGRFDVSQLVLEDLRKRIRSAMLVDRLNGGSDKRMTATEVMERASENALLLAATYGRLQAELLMPLIERVFAVLMRRGEIPSFDIDGQRIAIDIRSPVATIQMQRSVQSVLALVDAASKLGPDAMAAIDRRALVTRIAFDLGVPSDLLIPSDPQGVTEHV